MSLMPEEARITAMNLVEVVTNVFGPEYNNRVLSENKMKCTLSLFLASVNTVASIVIINIIYSVYHFDVLMVTLLKTKDMDG
jgi:hypothetical protein